MLEDAHVNSRVKIDDHSPDQRHQATQNRIKKVHRSAVEMDDQRTLVVDPG